MDGIKIKFSTNNKTKDKYFIVSKEDAERVKGHKWYLDKSGGGHLMVTRNAKTLDRFLGYPTKVKLHRYVLKVFDKKKIVDHINQDPLDNRRCNLRIVDHKTNMNNRKDNVK